MNKAPDSSPRPSATSSAGNFRRKTRTIRTTPQAAAILRSARLDPAVVLRFCLTDPKGESRRPAAVHKDLPRFLTRNRHALVELPRDHGKSTRFLREQIDGNPKVRQVFPHLMPWGTWAADAFTVWRPGVVIGPSVSAVGVAGGSTGTRADLLVCDDVVDVRSLNSKGEWG
jgi:hypothetical protein